MPICWAHLEVCADKGPWPEYATPTLFKFSLPAVRFRRQPKGYRGSQVANTKPYLSVLRDLEKRRQAVGEHLKRLQGEYESIGQIIEGLTLLVSTDMSGHTDLTASENNGSLAAMSMRWAILTVVGKSPDVAMSVSDIIEALKDGGFPTSDKLRANAGAVLSRMVGRGELANNGNSYAITLNGQTALKAIQMRRRLLTTASTDNHEVEDEFSKGLEAIP